MEIMKDIKNIDSKDINKETKDDGLVHFSYGDISFTKSSIPGFIIEGLIGQCITQVYQQLGYTNELQNNKKVKSEEVVKSIKALCVIAYEEADNVLDLTKEMKDATLKPKHKAFRNITKSFIERLRKEEKKLLKAKNRNNTAVVNSVKTIIDWLKSTTIVMSSYSDIKDIQKEQKEWL
jgi:hypothetical protein